MKTNLERLPFPNLLTELVNYGENKSFERKVKRVHALCVRQMHVELSDKIQAKYSQYFRGSDLVMAMMWALNAPKP